MKESDFAVWKEARDALFRNPTAEGARALLSQPESGGRRRGLLSLRGFSRSRAKGGWSDPEGPLASVHKARLQWLDASDAMLAESIAWLVERGYQTEMQGAPPLTSEDRDRQRVARGLEPLAASG